MDPFGDLDKKMETDMLKTKRDAFLALLEKPSKTEADLAAISAGRKDPFLEAVFLFRDYYYLKAKGEGSLSDVQMAQLKTMETKYPNIVRVYNDAKLKAMLGKGRRRKTPSRRKTNGGRRRKTRRNP